MIMTNPLISIIVPVFKVEQYLYECVQSIINQTYSNLEIILIDDGSPDSCPAMCDEYAKHDNRIRVIHKKNEGLSVARNIGIKESTGEWLFFLDSDDWISNNCIELLYERVIRHSDVQMVVGSYTQFGGHQDLSDCNFQQDFIVDKTHKWFIQAYLQGMVYEMAWNKLIKKDFVVRHYLYFEPGFINEDNLWSFMVACCMEKASFVSDVTLYYRIRQDSIMRNSMRTDEERHKWQSKIVLKKLDYVISNGVSNDRDIFFSLYCRIQHCLEYPLTKSFPEKSYIFYKWLRNSNYWTISQLKEFGLPRRILVQTLHRFLPKRLGYKFYMALFPKFQT